MRFDVISVFPEFFDVLKLSLVGKAQERGLIDVQSHDLRDWTHDVHRTVDDSPFGGGAGMVMKPDVWAEAIDTITGSEPFVLAIPTPSAPQLTQARCNELAQSAEHIVIACGRYEGIDSRVTEYYEQQPGVTVMPYSLGDYVLNGGEVAAVALIEAVGRLVPGMVGNPESLVEESHGSAGLLEYPVYTRPPIFRSIPVPEVLTSGNHGAVARWRRDQALTRTATFRPDMVAKLSSEALDKHDRAKLAELGWFLSRAEDKSFAPHLRQIQVRLARSDEAEAIAALAARTFPDAAPSYLNPADVQAFIDAHLQPANFAQLLADPEHNLLMVAQLEGVESLVGYTWTIIPEGDGAAGVEDGAPESFVTADGIPRSGPLMYLEKAYLDREWRGSGLFEYMMKETEAQIVELLSKRTPPPSHPYLWLGTNRENKRAQRAYKRYGFEYAGKRTFYVGEQLNNDVTMCLRIDMAK